MCTQFLFLVSYEWKSAFLGNELQFKDDALSRLVRQYCECIIIYNMRLIHMLFITYCVIILMSLDSSNVYMHRYGRQQCASASRDSDHCVGWLLQLLLGIVGRYWAVWVMCRLPGGWKGLVLRRLWWSTGLQTRWQVVPVWHCELGRRVC